MSANDPPVAYLTERLRAIADAQKMTVYCAHCPEWEFEGTAEAARAASATHRREEHPGVVSITRRVTRRRISERLSDEQKAEVEEERRRRLRAQGLL